MVDVVSSTDGLVIGVHDDLLDKEKYPASDPYRSGVNIIDERGWYYLYCHLNKIDPGIKLGGQVKMGQKIGILGKEHGSGGWAHLHISLRGKQPSGRYGIIDMYAFAWEEYHRANGTVLQAVARPHHFATVGQAVRLDGSRIWSIKGSQNIAQYEWLLNDGGRRTSVMPIMKYDKPGCYSEILKVRDKEGNVDYDFAVVQIVDKDRPEEHPPTIHAAYEPTHSIRVNQPVTFKVRSFRIGPKEGDEFWDFGDGSAPVKVQSDGNAKRYAQDGYAVVTHSYKEPGDYLVKVQRTNNRGETATAHLFVQVER